MKQGKIFWFKDDVVTPDSVPRGVIDVGSGEAGGTGRAVVGPARQTCCGTGCVARACTCTVAPERTVTLALCHAAARLRAGGHAVAAPVATAVFCALSCRPLQVNKCLSIKGAEDTINKPNAFEISTQSESMFFIADVDKVWTPGRGAFWGGGGGAHVRASARCA